MWVAMDRRCALLGQRSKGTSRSFEGHLKVKLVEILKKYICCYLKPICGVFMYHKILIANQYLTGTIGNNVRYVLVVSAE